MLAAVQLCIDGSISGSLFFSSEEEVTGVSILTACPATGLVVSWEPGLDVWSISRLHTHPITHPALLPDPAAGHGAT